MEIQTATLAEFNTPIQGRGRRPTKTTLAIAGMAKGDILKFSPHPHSTGRCCRFVNTIRVVGYRHGMQLSVRHKENNVLLVMRV